MNLNSAKGSEKNCQRIAVFLRDSSRFIYICKPGVLDINFNCCFSNQLQTCFFRMIKGSKHQMCLLSISMYWLEACRINVMEIGQLASSISLFLFVWYLMLVQLVFLACWWLPADWGTRFKFWLYVQLILVWNYYEWDFGI